MTIYAVFLNEPNPETWRRIEEFRGRRACFLTDNMAFVATGAPASTEETAAHAGVDEGRLRGRHRNRRVSRIQQIGAVGMDETAR